MDIPWKPVVGLEGWYEVGDGGYVRSLDREVTYKDGRKPRFFKGKMLTPFVTEWGYWVYTLYGEGHRRRVVQAQVLVLEAFVGPRPEGKTQIRHLDGNPANNHLSNLLYATPAENAADKVVHGTDHYAFRDACEWGHPFIDVNINVRRVKGKETHGARVCRACNAAGGALWRHGHARDTHSALFQAVSDHYLEVLLAGKELRGSLSELEYQAIVRSARQAAAG